MLEAEKCISSLWKGHPSCFQVYEPQCLWWLSFNSGFLRLQGISVQMSLCPASSRQARLKEGLYAVVRGSVPKGKGWFGFFFFPSCILIDLVHLVLFAEGSVVIKKKEGP